jgi:SET domain-containing protein
VRSISLKKPERLFVLRRVATGLGLLAVRQITKGQRIVEYCGRLLTNRMAERKGGRYLVGLDSRWTIDGSPRTNLARYVNHACTPNAEALIIGRRIWIYAIRAIKPGDEITMHYGKEYFEQFIEPVGCRCAHCRPAASGPREHHRPPRRPKFVVTNKSYAVRKHPPSAPPAAGRKVGRRTEVAPSE